MRFNTPFGAFALSGLSRLGRAKAYRVHRTRFTTMATQSVLRTRAYSKRPSSMSGMVLLNLSMLSLLPLLFDSVHGQSAYGYPRASSTEASDRKGKGKARDMSTSAPSAHTAVLSHADTAEAHSPSPWYAHHEQENEEAPRPPMIGHDRIAAQRQREPSYAMRLHAAESSLHPVASTSTASPPAVREQDSLSATHSGSASDATIPAAAQSWEESEEDRLHTQVRNTLSHLLSDDVPASLPTSGAVSMASLLNLPAFQACKIAEHLVNLDSERGLDPLHTVGEAAIRTLLRQCYRSSASAQEMPFLDRLSQLAVYDDATSQSSTFDMTAKDAYQALLVGRVFELLDAATQAGVQWSHHVATQALSCAQSYCEWTNVAIAWCMQPLGKSRVTAWPIEAELDTARVFRDSLHFHTVQALASADAETSEQVQAYKVSLDCYQHILTAIQSQTSGKRNLALLAVLFRALIEMPTPTKWTSSDAIPPHLARHRRVYTESQDIILKIVSCFSNEGLRALPKGTLRGGERHASHQLTRLATVMMSDIHCSAAVMRYLYRNRRRASRAERVYTLRVRPLLQRLQSRMRQTADAIDNDAYRNVTETYETLYQYIDVERIRGLTLNRANTAAEEAIHDCTSRLAQISSLPHYEPGTRPRGLSRSQADQFDAQDRLEKQMWQADVLITSPYASKHLIAAVVQLWSAALEPEALKYLARLVFSLRRELQLASAPGANAFSTLPTSPLDAETEHNTTRPIWNATTMRARLDQLFSSPTVIVSLINAANNMGNLSLTEKCWLVACEEEDIRQAWKLPTAAYTIMLRLYNAEQKRSSRTRTRQSRQASDDYRDCSSSRPAFSRATRQERSALRGTGADAAITLATSVYKRFAQTKSADQADARFFDAALNAFGHRGSAHPWWRNADSDDQHASSSRGSLRVTDHHSDSGVGSEADETMPELSAAESNMLGMIARDMVNQNYPVMKARRILKPGPVGLLSKKQGPKDSFTELTKAVQRAGRLRSRSYKDTEPLYYSSENLAHFISSDRSIYRRALNSVRADMVCPDFHPKSAD